MKMTRILYAGTTLLLVSCLHSKNNTGAIIEPESYNQQEMIAEDIDEIPEMNRVVSINESSNIKEILSVRYRLPIDSIDDLEISQGRVSKHALFYNETGYSEGPEIQIEEDGWIIKFYTRTYNADKTLRYKDYWEYFIPFHDSIIVRFNNFHGNGYHGGSRIAYKSKKDNRFDGYKCIHARNEEEELFARKMFKILRSKNE